MTPAADQLVRAVMDKLGCVGPTELARALNLGPNSPRLISRWLAGETQPGYEHTMLLLQKAGMLDPEAATGPDTQARLRQLEAQVDEIRQNQHAGVAAVTERLALLEAAVQNATQRSSRPSTARRN